MSKLVIGSFYRPPDKGIQSLVDLEMELAQISEMFKNNPKTSLILGGDFNAGGINWDLCTVDHDTSNRTLTLYDFEGGAPIFCPHAFNFGATLLCVGDFSK